MTRFAAQLEDSPFFANVLIERATTPDDYQFQLIINYPRPDSMAVRRLPMTVSRPLRAGR
jgi:hypothetical protein